MSRWSENLRESHWHHAWPVSGWPLRSTGCPDILSPASVDAQRCQETKALYHRTIHEATKIQRVFLIWWHCHPTILPCTGITFTSLYITITTMIKLKKAHNDPISCGHPHTFASTRSSCCASMLWCQLQHQGTAPWRNMKKSKKTLKNWF